MKFKVGDLVTLSSAGRKLLQNWAMKEGYGIVMQYSSSHDYPYELKWFQSSRMKFGGYVVAKPYDLNRLK